jgi:hypothetical protein
MKNKIRLLTLTLSLAVSAQAGTLTKCEDPSNIYRSADSQTTFLDGDIHASNSLMDGCPENISVPASRMVDGSITSRAIYELVATSEKKGVTSYCQYTARTAPNYIAPTTKSISCDLN